MKYRYPEAATFDEHSNEVAALLNAILHGGKCLQHSVITITGAAKTFADALKETFGADGLPAGAKSALCILESDALEVGQARVCRFKQDSGVPTATEGMPVGDNGSFEINGTDNIANFQIIGITGAHTHKLHITWFGAS